MKNFAINVSLGLTAVIGASLAFMISKILEQMPTLLLTF